MMLIYYKIYMLHYIGESNVGNWNSQARLVHREMSENKIDDEEEEEEIEEKAGGGGKEDKREHGSKKKRRIERERENISSIEFAFPTILGRLGIKKKINK